MKLPPKGYTDTNIHTLKVQKYKIMTTKSKSFFLRAAMTLLLMLLTATTAWADGVDYMDADGTLKNTATDGIVGNDNPTVLSSANDIIQAKVGSTLNRGWYLISGEFSYDSNITFNGGDGDVHIILADGANLTLSGINIPNCSLNIYGQYNGTGSLVVNGRINTNNLTINGGNITTGDIVVGGGNIIIGGGRITASNFYGGVSIADGYVYTDGTATYSGTLTNDERIAIAGKTLQPAALVTFNANGGSGTMTDQTFGIGQSQALTANVFTRVGYVFNGWNTQADGSGTAYADCQSVTLPSSMTLYAQWTPDPAHFSVNGDEYTIKTAGGWNVFCDALQDNDTWNRFSGKTVKLDANIEVSRMAGSSGHDFCGTFDGDGNTLTFNYGSSGTPASDEYIAPFCYVSTTKANPSDATESPAAIKNLHVTGDIYTSAKYAAGLVAQHWGTLNIENCRVSTVIHSSVSGDGTHGGFEAMNIGTLNITGCVFDGKLLTVNTGESATTNCGGFVGWHNNGTTNISNSLYVPAALGTGETEVLTGNVNNHPSATFGRDALNTLTNSYYTRTLGTAQGKAPRTVTAGDNVTVEAISPVGEPTSSDGYNGVYSVSGITAYAKGITRTIDETTTFYYGSEDEVSLTLSHYDRVGYHFSSYSANAGTLNGNDTDGYTLTMPDQDVTISANYELFEFNQDVLHYEIISGTNVKVAGCNSSATSITIPATVTYDNVTYDVTAIDAAAFEDCTSLTTVTMQATTPPTLGKGAFDACTALTHIYVPVGCATAYQKEDNWYDYESIILYVADGTCGEGLIWSFSSTTNTLTISGTGAMADYDADSQPWAAFKTDITTVIIEDGVTAVGSNAFNGCTDLEIAYFLPTAVPTMQGNVFDGCTSLDAIVVPAKARDSYWSDWYYGHSYSYADDRVTKGYTITCAAGITVTGFNNGPMVQPNEIITITYTVPDAAPEGYTGSFLGYQVKGSDNIIRTVNAPGNTFQMPDCFATVLPAWTPIAWSGSGSSTDPYIINYPSQLDLLASNVNSITGNTDYADTYFELGNDIVYAHATDWDDVASTENNFTTIGVYVTADNNTHGSYYSRVFNGHFDGKGHRISGLRIYGGGNSQIVDGYRGIFGQLGASGSVSGVKLEDTRIVSHCYAGGIAGQNDGTISDCHVAANVCFHIINYGATTIGGITGSNHDGTISGCTSAVSITSTTANSPNPYKIGTRIGGIAGSNHSPVKDCLYLGTTLEGEEMLGAIAGSNNSTIQNCYDSSSALTITLGEGVALGGTATEYGGLTAYGDFALSDGTTIYSAEGNTIELNYTGEVPAAGYRPAYSYNDGSDHSFTDNTFEMPDGSVTVSAGVAAITYTITYHPNDGEFTTDKNSYTVESADITLDEPTRTFYDFGGWYTNSSLSSPAVTSIDHGSMGNKEFWAKWTPITFTAGALSYEYTSGTDVKVTACDNSTTTVTIPATVTYNAVTFSVTAIEADAFASCTELTTIFMRAATPPALGTDVLDACTALTDIYVPVSNVDDYTTADNWSEYASIIKGYDGTCGDNVYWSYNSSGKTLTIFGTGAMDNYGSTNRPWQSLLGEITTVIIDDGVTIIGGRAFESCNNLTSVNIPNNVTVIAGYAFAQCPSLKSVNMGSGVTTIGSGAFGLTGLESVSLPASLTSIGAQAFATCPLTSVSIPARVTSIGNQAFWGCISLNSVTIYAPGLDNYGYLAFQNNADGRKIYVYSGCVDTYKAGWSDYADDILPIKDITLAANEVDGNYWTTFYCGHTGYKIDNEENACAYTAEYDDVNSELTLHKLGKEIPAGTAVIIVGEDSEISMTASDEGADVPANNLRGCDVRTLKSTLGEGTFYVLGKVSGDFGFFKYTGDYMPASKAYLLIDGDALSARGIRINFGEVNSIHNAECIMHNYAGANTWHDLQGRKLSAKPTAPGIYINNGKAVVIE